MNEPNQKKADGSELNQRICSLKIGRHEYTITEKDVFMDNGCSVQLLTQSKETSSWGSRPNPSVSKRAVKEMSHLERVQHDHNYGEDVQVFNLANTKLKDE